MCVCVCVCVCNSLKEHVAGQIIYFIKYYKVILIRLLI